MSINVFNVPRVLKEPLADFLNVPICTTMSYIDITRAIKEYIDNNNLIDRRTLRISPDKRLCDLFGIQPGETIQYLNVTHYIYDLVERRVAAAN